MAMNQLKVVVSVLDEVQKGNFPTHTDYGIEKSSYAKIIKAMCDDDLLSDVLFNDVATSEYPIFMFSSRTAVTIKGMEYLNNNSTIMKTYRGLKEIREWLPF